VLHITKLRVLEILEVLEVGDELRILEVLACPPCSGPCFGRREILGVRKVVMK